MSPRPLSKREIQASISKQINTDLKALEKLPDFDNKEYLQSLLHDFMIDANARVLNPSAIEKNTIKLLASVASLTIDYDKALEEKAEEQDQEILKLRKEVTKLQREQGLPITHPPIIIKRPPTQKRGITFVGKSPLKKETRMTESIYTFLKNIVPEYYNISQQLQELDSQEPRR